MNNLKTIIMKGSMLDYGFPFDDTFLPLCLPLAYNGHYLQHISTMT